MSTPTIDINQRIASRVRALRSEQGLSLDDLAAKSGVSRSMISLIERGESSPTAVVLEKISAGFGVPLASLFETSDEPTDPVSRARDRVAWKDPETGYVRRNISPSNYPAPFKIVEVVLPPGAHVAYDGSARDGSLHQQIWVQEGCLELTSGSAPYSLDAGDCLAMQLDGPNSFRNRTKKPVRYVVVVTTERLGMGKAKR
jgi:transcriptional regulator with XRE-family HTH domain